MVVVLMVTNEAEGCMCAAGDWPQVPMEAASGADHRWSGLVGGRKHGMILIGSCGVAVSSRIPRLPLLRWGAPTHQDFLRRAISSGSD